MLDSKKRKKNKDIDKLHAPADIQLRPYQRDCLETILEEYRLGIRRQLICLPTGTGKTVIFAEFPNFFKMKKQMLVLAHREELLNQALDKIQRANPALTIQVEQANRRADAESDVVIASVPTLGRRGSKRLKRLNPDNFFLIVVDEAHHATASTYQRVLEYFGVFQENTKKLLVGFTATPKRGDGIGLEEIFQKITFSRNLPEMINAGFLASIAAYRVDSDIDLSDISVRLGDFVASQLSDTVNVQSRNELIVNVYNKYLKDKKALCFCVDVKHSHSLAKSFVDAGISAAAITGNTEKEHRVRLLNEFSEGKIKVLANCMVLTEGYDEPSIEGIILARPTKSELLYTQMIGRGTRLHQGKEAVNIIDIVDNTIKHDLANIPSLFGLSEKFNLEGHTTTEAQKAIEWVEKNRPWVLTHKAKSLSDLRYRCQKINLFELQTPARIYDFSSFAWVQNSKEGYRLGLKDGKALLVEPDILGKWEVILREKGENKLINQENNLRNAILKAEYYIEKKYPQHVKLVSRYTRWRMEPASEKQRKILSKWKLEIPPNLTKGQASHLIGMLIHT